MDRPRVEVPADAVFEQRLGEVGRRLGEGARDHRDRRVHSLRRGVGGTDDPRVVSWLVGASEVVLRVRLVPDLVAGDACAVPADEERERVGVVLLEDRRMALHVPVPPRAGTALLDQVWRRRSPARGVGDGEEQVEVARLRLGHEPVEQGEVPLLVLPLRVLLERRPADVNSHDFGPGLRDQVELAVLLGAVHVRPQQVHAEAGHLTRRRDRRRQHARRDERDDGSRERRDSHHHAHYRPDGPPL